MNHLSKIKQTQDIQGMFSRIADHYDLMNSIITVGQDRRWRREIVRRASLPQGGWLLDLGTGTGGLTQEALLQHPTCHIVAVDINLDMIRTGRRHARQFPSMRQSMDWCASDAVCLPFPDQTFDAVISGFLIRNVIDLRKCLTAQFQVLKSGGMIVVLDTTPPERSLFSPFTLFYFRMVVPTMGKIIARHFEDYKYLSISTENFLHAEQLIACLTEAGFQEVCFARRMLGTIAIHWGRKP